LEEIYALLYSSGASEELNSMAAPASTSDGSVIVLPVLRNSLFTLEFHLMHGLLSSLLTMKAIHVSTSSPFLISLSRLE